MRPSIMKKLLQSSRCALFPTLSHRMGEGGLLTVAAAGLLSLISVSQAFPPAPSHSVYGQVRDEYGVPLSVTNALIVFEAPNTEPIISSIDPRLEPGINYRLNL